MKYLYLGCLLLAAALLTVSAPTRPAAGAPPAPSHTFLNVEQLKWGPPPPGLPTGAQVSVLYGDPHAAGPFVVRLRTPSGYQIPPHWHTMAENLTVLSGALYIGMTDKMDRSQAHPLNPGGYHFLPAKAHHFAFTEVPTVVQIQGEGPFDINYLNPGDDPRSQRR